MKAIIFILCCLVYSAKRKVPIYKTKGARNFQKQNSDTQNEIAVFFATNWLFKSHLNSLQSHFYAIQRTCVLPK